MLATTFSSIIIVSLIIVLLVVIIIIIRKKSKTRREPVEKTKDPFNIYDDILSNENEYSQIAYYDYEQICPPNDKSYDYLTHATNCNSHPNDEHYISMTSEM